MAEEPVCSEITGTVWKIELAVGAEVAEDDVIMILESMKMEIPVLSPGDGVLAEILVEEGAPVAEGQVVAKLKK
ncbi:MAG: acetyl-CoA carboxylase biotin carboxyl carrier protein subunit [Pararhodobacter sp.]|nr:acetyl-CoA carboxylase biotin carboxyl carrier protein subunit [Pararhodobacter sp.]